MLGNIHITQVNIIAAVVNGYTTRDLLQQILNDEVAHNDGIEGLQAPIEQMTFQVFLTKPIS